MTAFTASATDVVDQTPTTRSKGSNPMQTLHDTWLIFRRSLVLTIRQPTWIVIGIMYPVIYLVLFGPLLDGAIKQAGAGVSAYNWFVPGLLIQVALFGTAFGGFGLIAELRYGVVERMRVTPMSRSAMLLGRSLRDVAILLFQALIMIGLALPFGLHLDLGGVIVTLGLLALIGLVVAPLSYSAALILKSEDAFAPLVQSLVMPLLLLSGILLPMALAPDWLRFLSNLNPLTHATDAARALFNSDWGNPEIAIGVGITTVLAIVAVWIASRTFSRANA
jgi:ABC-2 type transport system permease protein